MSHSSRIYIQTNLINIGSVMQLVDVNAPSFHTTNLIIFQTFIRTINACDKEQNI